jgi:hypothetical protein
MLHPLFLGTTKDPMSSIVSQKKKSFETMPFRRKMEVATKQYQIEGKQSTIL